MAQHKAGHLKHWCFWAVGVYDILAVDQHDKWKRFGLALHTGIDPFPGWIHWIQVWWTNNNPKLILSYYLEFIERFKCRFLIYLSKLSTHLYVDIPLVSQSDPRSENYGIANVQTTLHHWHDPNLAGKFQHCWMQQKKNVNILEYFYKNWYINGFYL